MSTTKIKALKPPKSVFNLSYEKKFDFDMGQLIPVCCEEMVPGDYFKVGNEIVIRFNPMFAPVLQEINAYVHYFFVPTRLIFDNWENFITGGEDGKDTTILPRFYKNGAALPSGVTATTAFGPYSLYDYFGFPVVKNSSNAYSHPGYGKSSAQDGFQFRPLSFPWRVYNLCWNEYYRDENLQDEVDLDQPLVLNRNWSKDYFTSSLYAQQRGVAGAVTMRGYLPVIHADEDSVLLPNQLAMPIDYDNQTVEIGGFNMGKIYSNREGENISGAAGFGPAFVNLANGVGIDVSELRTAFQMQKWMERNMRAGVRYTEFLHAHYSVSPRDDRLQRPEYLGGSKSPIIVSEVIQTSETSDQTTPTGKLYGKGITADRNFICKYHAKEFGYLIGIMSVLPKATYQQGVDRQWLRKSRFDFYTPEFAHLSEQEVTTEELFAFAGVEDNGDVSKPIGNGTIFGYQARFNEMRANRSKVCGAMRDTLDYWHLGRQFDSVPQLNSDFITCDATRDDLKRIFQVQSAPGLVCNFANIITAIRPLPKFGEPGLVDHN